MKQVEQEKRETVDLKNLHGGLEILVQLAEKGEIDPWDVDIIEVTDKYLEALDKSPRENLLNAGRAIFFASVLLRLKSDILLNLSNETLIASQQTENYFPEDELLDQDDVRLDLSRLESFLIRSSLSKQQRKRKISLGDLIFALQQAEEEEERRALRAKLRVDNAFKIVAPETPDDLLEMVQEEDVEETVNKIEALIEEHLTDEKPITLSFLAEILNDKIKPFIALLFLAHSQKVVLDQKDFYGETFIYRGGTVIEEKQVEEKQEAEIQRSREKKRRKDKIIHGKRKEVEEDKPIEVIANESLPSITIEIKNNEESEVIDNGNTGRESDVGRNESGI